MTSLTDRYVAATVRGLDASQRADVERELRGTIEDMVQARLDAGTATPEEAERAVLVELGDPMRLASGYSGTPLHLIGPTVFPQWRRLVTLLLWTVVPLVTVLNLVVRLFVDDVAVDGVGPAFGNAALTGLMVALHVVFWTTLVFAVLERTGSAEVGAWTPEQLPEPESSRSVGLGETVGSVVVLVLMGVALVWQQTSSPVRRGDEAVPVVDPALWGQGWLPFFLLAILAQAVVAVLAFRRRRWTLGLAVAGAVVDVLATAALLWLLRTESLFDDRFREVLVAGGWTDAVRDLSVGIALGVVVIVVWDQVETFRRVRTDRLGVATA